MFVLLVVASCWMLFQKNPYQQHVFLTSANRASAVVYKGAGEVTSYFNLRSINSDLQERNATLEMEVINLKRQIGEYKTLLQPSGIALPDSVAQNYEYHFANVINNSVTHPKNFITIDKGRLDGIAPEMGVVDQNGVVGIVSNVSDHASRVLSLLNSDMRLSCKVKNTDYLVARHRPLPRHARGDAEAREVPPRRHHRHERLLGGVSAGSYRRRDREQPAGHRQ